MNIGIQFDGNAYLVQCYATLNSEIMPLWHTCRKFKHQGDAVLFRELCRAHKLDPIAFAKTYNHEYICTFFTMRNGKPKLTMNHENNRNTGH